MHPHLLPTLAGTAAALWSLVFVMIAAASALLITVGVIGLAASTTAVTGQAIMLRLHEAERRRDWDWQRRLAEQEGYQRGCVDTAHAIATHQASPMRRAG